MLEKIPLSLIIITHRADKRFLQALESAQFAQEVLIVDHQSSNNWSTLKKQFQFKVLPWDKALDDFSAIRNWAAKQAQFDWLFFLDSDEIIEKSSLAIIKDIIQNNQNQLIQVRRIDIFAEQELKHGETGKHYLIRMGKKTQMHWQRKVHEIVKENYPMLKSKIVLRHFAHLNINEFITDISRYAQIETTSRYPQNIKKVKLEMLSFPIAKFILNYFLKLGCLDGFAGLVYAVIMSLHSLLVRVYLYEKYCEK